MSHINEDLDLILASISMNSSIVRVEWPTVQIGGNKVASGDQS